MPERLYTINAAAALYGCAPATLRQRIARGTVSSIRSQVTDQAGNVLFTRHLITQAELDRITAARAARN